MNARLLEMLEYVGLEPDLTKKWTQAVYNRRDVWVGYTTSSVKVAVDYPVGVYLMSDSGVVDRLKSATLPWHLKKQSRS